MIYEKKIIHSRKKDYTDPYRKLVYDNDNEMNEVLGKFENNEFLIELYDKTTVFIGNLTLLLNNE